MVSLHEVEARHYDPRRAVRETFVALRAITPEIRQFLDGMIVPCVISTLRADGAPITSATWFGFFDDDIIVATPTDRTKARNVRADPRISFIVDTKTMPFRGVAIEGTAELMDDPDGTLLMSIATRYLGPDGALAARARLEARGERVIVRIRPQRVRPWAIESIGNPRSA
jgi:PPOX class probable F420-dependent enzyme